MAAPDMQERTVTALDAFESRKLELTADGKAGKAKTSAQQTAHTKSSHWQDQMRETKPDAENTRASQ